VNETVPMNKIGAISDLTELEDLDLQLEIGKEKPEFV
jgi:hypothetical protein